MCSYYDDVTCQTSELSIFDATLQDYCFGYIYEGSVYTYEFTYSGGVAYLVIYYNDDCSGPGAAVELEMLCSEVAAPTYADNAYSGSYSYEYVSGINAKSGKYVQIPGECC